jgi:hypothetical protein
VLDCVSVAFSEAFSGEDENSFGETFPEVCALLAVTLLETTVPGDTLSGGVTVVLAIATF